MNMYQEALMDHYRNPRNRGTLALPDFSSGMANPSCGDAVSLHGILTHGVIEVCLFEGKGCVISQATASLLTEKVRGKTIAEVATLNADAMQTLIGMQLGPTRLKCALLPLEALKNGLQKVRNA